MARSIFALSAVFRQTRGERTPRCACQLVPLLTEKHICLLSARLTAKNSPSPSFHRFTKRRRYRQGKYLDFQFLIRASGFRLVFARIKYRFNPAGYPARESIDFRGKA